MLAALYPEYVIEKKRHFLHVETAGSQSRGATVVDWLERSGRTAQTEIVLKLDQARFEALIQDALGVRV
jgi:purine nucleosidase